MCSQSGSSRRGTGRGVSCLVAEHLVEGGVQVHKEREREADGSSEAAPADDDRLLPRDAVPAHQQIATSAAPTRLRRPDDDRPEGRHMAKLVSTLVLAWKGGR